MKPEIAVARLSIIDGAWQEAPDNVALFDKASLFESGLERGSLYIVAEVAGDPEGRDALARELIETARREYAASRGSISLALTQAVRAANDFFYTKNANAAPEARRIAGMTAAILRDHELFIAQAGPGLTCVVRDGELQRYPTQSAWFDPDEAALSEWLASRDFQTPGTVPIGLRRNYTPDLFHVSLQPGDIVVLSTRSLAHLLTDEELLDTLAQRHPDEIIANLEDLAGAADVSVIVLRVGEVPARPPARALMAPSRDSARTPPPAPQRSAQEIVSPPSTAPTTEDLALQRAKAQREAERKRLQAEKGRARRANIRAAFLRVTAGAMALLARITGRINWTLIGTAADRAISAVLRDAARAIVFLIRAALPGEPKEETTARGARGSARSQTAWQLAALVFPALLIALGGGMWVNYRADQQRLQAAQTAQLIKQSNAALESAKRLAATDKNAARDAAQQAIALAQEARTLASTNRDAHTAYYDAEDWLDGFNGVSVLLYLPTFATFSDAKANPTRIVSHYPDVFILDRGTQRIYRYAVNEAGSSAAPASGDGVILKSGDKIDNRTAGELIDIAWIDTGRLATVDRNGAFLQYDPAKATWSARTATDGSQWGHVSIGSSYGGNLYLADPARNQILKYVANLEGWWTSAVTYFAPGVNPDLSNVVDLTLDENVWLLRGDGSIFRYTTGKPNELTVRDLETPLSKPTSAFTSPALAGIYIADAGNQRVVQIDKTNGKFVRQFKPSAQNRAAFDALKALTVDEANKKFFFINGNQAYLANIPQ